MEKRKIGLGIASIILGSIGLVTSCMCIGIVPGIVGVILSVVGLNEENQKNNVCIIGLITSSVSVLISLIISIVFLATPTDTSESSYVTTENSTEIQVEKTTETTKDLTETTTEEVTTASTTEEMKTEETTEEITIETEEEYKSKCQEMYYDDFFSEYANVSVGDYVKFNSFISGKAEYYSSDIFGIVIQDIDEIYDFRNQYISSCVLHEETKDNVVPSYFGESVYLMFPENSDLYIENYEPGQHCIIYGEVIQTQNGIFIIPKYIEIE